MANLESQRKRTELPERHAAHWQRIRPGVHVGYRKTKNAGTWLAKVEIGSSRQQKSLGTLPERTAFEDARKLTEAWVVELEGGVRPEKHTVWAACLDHVAAIKAERGAEKAQVELKRLALHVESDPLGQTLLSALRRSHMDAWRARMRAKPVRLSRTKTNHRFGPRSDSTLNRDMTPLRAALNRAHAKGLAATDLPWREALRAVRGAGGRRTLYLDKAQRAALVEKTPIHQRGFVLFLASVPVRPGAAAKAVSSDLQGDLLRISYDKVKGERWVRLPAALAFSLRTEQPAGVPLFEWSPGRQWNKDLWYDVIHDAAVAAGLPKGTCAYTLRHSVITDLVVDGLDLLTVARLAGTSVVMIERHYGHLRQDVAVKALEALQLA